MCYVITVPVTGLLCQSWSVLPQDCRLCLEAGDCIVSTVVEMRPERRWKVTGDPCAVNYCTCDWVFVSHLVILIYLHSEAGD